jgi:extradiol dioxygenase family protein
LINVRMIEERDGKWYLEGSSEVFSSRVEAIRRAKQLGRNKKDNGRKFVSQKLGMVFRSNWEIELAELMTDLGIKWVYEPERVYFRAEGESYLYDFYLPQYNVVIEVKGYMDKRSLRRVKLFKKYYGHKYGFFLFEKEERDLVIVKGMTEVLFKYIEIAQKEQERELRKHEK